MRADVAVVGGGSAGIAAAVCAARTGARVVLFERSEIPGGQAAGALVHSICGLYLLRDDEAQPLIPANPGFPMEFASRLLAMGGARGPVRMGRLDVLLHEPTAFASLAAQFCAELPNLELRLNSGILGAACAGGGIVLRFDGGELEAAAVVDATGDGDVAALAGAGWEQAPADRLQRPAYIFKLAGVPASALSGDARLGIARALSAAVTDGHLPSSALGAAFRMGVAEGEAWGTIDLAAGGFDPCDHSRHREIENEGRTGALRIAGFLREKVPGFSAATVSALPARAGIRESRRIVGRYGITADDIIRGATFADAVARTAWPMESRERPTGPRFRFPTDNRSCEIPLRTLRARDVENLFMAGRCISCSHEAQASIRVIGTCLATGEAAGNAAAIHAV